LAWLVACQGGKRLAGLLHDVRSYRLEGVPIRHGLSREGVQHVLEVDHALSGEQAELLVDVREVPHLEVLRTAVEAGPIAIGMPRRNLVQQMPSMRE
jgi:hypothetical protein